MMLDADGDGDGDGDDDGDDDDDDDNVVASQGDCLLLHPSVW